jgi:argininosuccinate lyase
MRQRVREPLGEPFIDSVLRPRLLADVEASLPAMLAVNKAHLVMLHERQLVPADAAASLARALADIESTGLPADALDPGLEDLYANLERTVARAIGEDHAGRLHVGRSRNDLWATIARMNARACVDRALASLLELRGTLLTLTDAHADVVVPGYTHLQPAQPITLGFYFMGLEQALARDWQRLEQSYTRVNRCPLGAAAFAGTSFPIDRPLTARLLGFEAPLDNALDAVASRDYVLEILSAFAILASTLARMAEDLYFWSSAHIGLLDFSGAVAVASSIMPQKKNAAAIEHVKGRAAHVVGALIASLAATKGTHYMHSRDNSVEVVLPLAQGEQSLTVVLTLTRAVLEAITVRRDVAARLAASEFSTITDLADLLVRKGDVPFRIAHEICATLVLDAADTAQRTAPVTAAVVTAAAAARLGRPVQLSDDDVRAALDPELSVARRDGPGGPAPATVRAARERAVAALARDRTHLLERGHAIAGAAAELDRRCRAIQR